MNRRAGQKAEMLYWGKRIAVATVFLCLGIGMVAYAVSSGYFVQLWGRGTRSFHAEMVDGGFQIRNVYVDGRNYTDKAALKSIVEIEKGQSIFEPDLVALQENVSHLKWVKAAVVERRLPDTIVIRLTERQPLALWQHHNKIDVIDTDGELIAEPNLTRFKMFPILVGDDAPDHAASLVSLLNAEADLRTRVESAKWIGGRRWDLYLRNGVVVKLPEDDLGQAVRRLAEAQRDAKLMDKNIRGIDLRDPLRIVVQTSPEVAEDYQAAFHPEKAI